MANFPYPPIPYVSQQGNLTRNDCGPACVAMGAGALGIVANVAELSRLVDANQNGTAPADLIRCYAHLGIKAERASVGSARRFPYIALVWYPKLPHIYDSKYIDWHWIMRLGPDASGVDRYHDPYWDGTAGALLAAGPGVLDGAEQVPHCRIVTPAIWAPGAGAGQGWAFRVVGTGISVVDSIGVREKMGGAIYALYPSATVTFEFTQPPKPEVKWVSDKRVVEPQGPVVLSWEVVGDVGQVKQLRFWTSDRPGAVLTLATMKGSDTRRPEKSKSFVLEITWADGGIEKKEIPVKVIAPVKFEAVNPGTGVAVSEVKAGETVRLKWAVEGVEGVWFDDGSGYKGVEGVAAADRTPGKDTVYRLKVQQRDGDVSERGITIKVVGGGPGPLPARVQLLGVHCNQNAHILRGMYEKGCRLFLVLDNHDMAKELAQMPGTLVVFRRYLNGWQLTAKQIMDYTLQGGGIGRANLLYQCMNEQDEMPYDTPARMRARGLVEVEYARIMADAGMSTILGSWSMGTPEYLNDDMCKVIEEVYAPGYNARKYWIGYHSYSPTMRHLPGIRGLEGAMAVMPAEMPTKAGKIVVYEQRKDKQGKSYVVSKLVADPSMRAIPAEAQREIERALGGPEEDWDWYETRHRFLPWKCGFDPSVDNILGNEGLFDEGGVGGCRAHGMTLEQVSDMLKATRLVQAAPFKVNGQLVRTMYRGTCAYQVGEDQKWAGYLLGMSVDDMYMPAFHPLWP